jgi:streptogramin lyase
MNLQTLLGLFIKNGAVGRHRLRSASAVILCLSALGAGSAAPAAAQAFSEFPIPGGSPGSIVAGPDGKLWFTEPGADRIGQISTAGLVREFQLPPGRRPQGIAAGFDGNLWFAETIGAIGRITPAGLITHFAVPSEHFPNAPNIPFGMAAGTDGNLWFTEPPISRVGKISTAGAITQFPIDYDGPFAVTGSSDGNLWFTVRAYGESKICRITPAGVNDAFGHYGQFSDPGGVTAGPDGNIWFTEETGNKIDRITPAGVISQFPLSSRGNPFGITAGPDGNLWFTEKTGNKIGRITTAGVITEFSIPSAGSGPTWIALGPDGNLWFAEEAAQKIGRLTLATASVCVTDATTLCLNNGRFQVRAQWSTADGASGIAQAVALTSEAGYFTFFDPANVELIAKVLNGCSFNSRFWLFASGLTDVHVVISVVDSATGVARNY